MPTHAPRSDSAKDVHADTLTPEFVADLVKAVAAHDDAKVQSQTKNLHASDLADFVELLKPEDRVAFISMLGPEFDPALFSELEEKVRDALLESLDPALVARALRALEDSGDVLSLVEHLHTPEQERVLEHVPDVAREEIEHALEYPEKSAGRLMQRSLVALPDSFDIGSAIDHLRTKEDLPSDFPEIYVVDPDFHPVGSLTLSLFTRSHRHVQLEDIMKREPISVPTDMDQEEVAHLFRKYHLVSAPVVDENKCLVGMITADDVFKVMSEEAEEDIKRLGGVGRDSVFDTAFAAARGRFRWLFVNLLTAILVAFVISLFEASIERLVALAILMPIVASMGGVAGTQTLTIAVRALATQDIIAANQKRIIWREIAIGIMNGLVFAGILGAIGGTWFQNPLLGVVLSSAVIVNMFAAAAAGILIPLGLRRIHVDPAIASGVFVTTVTDVIGFFSFLGLATVFLL